ncbi:MAG TPA: hypothetical protein VK524_35225 [Polyangiaceae bacterium]|nr:hypothetical protein [Polyangiaceae bacterium]
MNPRPSCNLQQMRHLLRSCHDALLCAAIVWSVAAGCAPAPQRGIEPHNISTPPPASPQASATASAAPLQRVRAPVRRHAPSIELVAAPTSSTPESVAVEIAAPAADAVIKKDQLRYATVRLNLKNWKLARPGPSVLVALDSFRPKNVHTLAAPLPLSDFVDENAELQPGQHVLVAMLARASGETLKPSAASPRPFHSRRFWVETRGSLDAGAPEEPLLVYNLPRGTYNGEAASQSVLVDYYVLGTALGEGGPRLRITVTGTEASAESLLSEWRPLHIKSLESGDYTVRLEVLAADGKVVPGQRTSAERVISVNRDAPVGKSE